MSFLLTAFKTLLFTAFKDCISAPRLATSGATSGTSAMAKILEFEFESHKKTMKDRDGEFRRDILPGGGGGGGGGGAPGGPAGGPWGGA